MNNNQSLTQFLTNDVRLSGTLTYFGDVKTSRDGHIYHVARIQCMRLSSTFDNISLVIPHSLTRNVTSTSRVSIRGKLCASYNKDAPRHNKTRVWVRVNELTLLNDDENIDDNLDDINETILTTAFCDVPQTRHTPQGRLIADAFVYVRPRVYVPAIAWGQTAIDLAHYNKDEKIKILARLQSREFECLNDENKIESYETIEICIQKIMEEDK